MFLGHVHRVEAHVPAALLDLGDEVDGHLAQPFDLVLVGLQLALDKGRNRVGQHPLVVGHGG